MTANSIQMLETAKICLTRLTFDRFGQLLCLLFVFGIAEIGRLEPVLTSMSFDCTLSSSDSIWIAFASSLLFSSLRVGMLSIEPREERRLSRKFCS